MAFPAFSKTQEFVLPGFCAQTDSEEGDRFVGLKNLDVESIASARITGFSSWPSLFLQSANSDPVFIHLTPLEGYERPSMEDYVAFARALGWNGPIEFEFVDRRGDVKGVIHAQES